MAAGREEAQEDVWSPEENPLSINDGNIVNIPSFPCVKKHGLPFQINPRLLFKELFLQAVFPGHLTDTYASLLVLQAALPFRNSQGIFQEARYTFHR